MGLYFYNARYYDPALGRFVQADTIVPSPGNPQSFNRYSYTLNNPLKYADPSGHCPQCAVLTMSAPFGPPGWIVGGAILLVSTVVIVALAVDVVVDAPPVAHPLPPIAPPIARPTVGTPPPMYYSRDGTGPDSLEKIPVPTPGPTLLPLGPAVAPPTMTPTPEPDRLIWRGIDGPVAKPRDFRPRPPTTTSDGRYNPRDLTGLSFSEFPSGVGSKSYAGAISSHALEQAGFTVTPDGGQIVFGEQMPEGHVSVRLRNPIAWNNWLYNRTGGWDGLLSGMVQKVLPNPCATPQ